MDATSLEEYNKRQEQRKADIESEKRAKLEEQEERRRRLNELQGKMKISLDDQKDYS